MGKSSVPKRHDRSVPPKPSARIHRAGGQRWLLCILAVAIPGLALLVALLRPIGGPVAVATSQDDTPPVLPTEPEPRTVEELTAEGEQAVAQLLARYPQTASAHQAAAMLYQTLNQYERVTEHWKKCLDLDSSKTGAWEWLADAQLKQGADEDAFRTLTKALQTGLASAPIYQKYVTALQRKGELAEAEKAGREGLTLHPEDVGLWIALGRTQLQLEKLADARDSFLAALRLKPDSIPAHFAASGVCLRLGEKEAAAEHKRRVDEWNAAAQADELTFEQEYEDSLRLSVSVVLSLAATTCDEHGDSDEAERLCQRAYTIHPGYPDSYRQLVNLYHRQGRIASALAVQQRLAVVEPENEANYLNLASLLLELRQVPEAEEILVNASRSAPRKGVFSEHLATIALLSGQLPKARQYAEEAVRREPSPARFRLLAEICRQQGDASGEAAAMHTASEYEMTAIPSPKKTIP